MASFDHPYRSLNLVGEPVLHDRFAALWQRCLIPGAASDAETIWAKLNRRYREPHRRYHNRNHLAHCLAELDLAGDRIKHPDQVEMAIWFHDVINEPGERDNELLSADYFREKASGVMDAGFINAVVDLILVTTHEHTPSDTDQQFICDIDLTSFGCPWECFLRDSAAVKAEFPGTDTEYYRGKTAFLEGMLARPRIFLSEFFHDRYERQARENIGLLLEEIRQKRH